MSAYWQPELVNDFKSADKSFATEPDTVANCITKASMTVTKFCSQSSASQAEEIGRLQTHLLGNLKITALPGVYSTYWENSLYSKGYAHPETIRLAYL